MFGLVLWNLNGCEKQTFQETAVSPMRKKWPTSPAFTEHGRSQSTSFNADLCLLAIIVQVVTSFW